MTAAAGGSIRVAIDGNGNAIVVYQRSSGSVGSIFARRFTPAGGWGAEQSLETLPGTAFGPAIAMDSTGRATAVWTQSDGGWRTYANRFSGSTWSGAVPVQTAGSSSSSGASVAMDPNGAALVAWSHQDTSTAPLQIRASRFTTSWSANAVVDSTTTDWLVSQAHVAVDSLGNGVVVYIREDSATFIDHVWGARFTTASGWAAPTSLEPTSNNSAFPRISLNAAGDGVAVWELSGSGVRARRFSAATGWGANQIVNAPGGTANMPDIATDTAGSAVAVWRQGGSPIRVVANQMSAAGEWSVPKNIDSNAFTAFAPRIALSGSGGGIVAWGQASSVSGAQHIWANRF